MIFLNNVKSVVDTLQIEQIVSSLNKKKERGEITSSADYQAAMQSALIALQKTQTDSTFRRININYDRAYSELINQNFENIENDLKVAFAEINNLYNIINNHEDYYKKKVEDFKRIIANLNAKLDKAKIEASRSEVFNQVRAINFSDRSMKISPEHPDYTQFFFDTKSRENKTSASEMVILNEQHRLQLKNKTNVNVPISNIAIIETETSSSLYNVNSPNIDLQEILTDESTTWFFNVNSEENLDHISLGLNINLGDKKRVNRLALKINNKYPIEISEVSYFDEFGSQQQLLAHPQIISDDFVLSFPQIIVKDFKIIFKQYSNELMSYDANAQQFVLEDLQRLNNIPNQNDLINHLVEEELSNPTNKKIIAPPSIRIEDKKTLFNYTIGLKEISCSNDEAVDYGIFVGAGFSFFASNLLAIDTNETIFSERHKVTQMMMPTTTIEYSVIIKEYDGENNLLRTREFPMLPKSYSKVYAESMPFSSDKKILPLRFIGHKTDGDGSNIEIYRDGELLIRGVDWRFADRVDLNDDGDSQILPGKEQTLIEILNANDIIQYSHYYASYSPRFLLEMNRTTYDHGIHYTNEKAIILPEDMYGTYIQQLKIYPKIIVRSLVKELGLSPYVSNLKILTREVSHV